MPVLALVQQSFLHDCLERHWPAVGSLYLVDTGKAALAQEPARDVHDAILHILDGGPHFWQSCLLDLDLLL